jgi:uncharacterized protein (TIRG00374 family)
VIQQLGGFALAGVLIWLVLRGTDPKVIWQQLQQASIVGLVFGAVVNVSHNIFRTWRWGALLEPVRPKIPFRPMFAAIMLGYMTSWTVPGRLGELVRPALLSSRERIPLGPCLGSVVADRLLDGLAILILFAVGLLITPLPDQSAELVNLILGATLAMVALIGAVMAVLLAASTARARLENWIGQHHGLLPWIGRSLLSVADGAEALKRPRLLFRVFFHTMMAWIIISVGMWIGMRACGADVSLGVVLVIQPLVALGIALPTPGGAGGFHAAVTFGLAKIFGVPQAVAIGTGFLVHLMVVTPVLVIGSLLLLLDRLPFHDLLEAGRRVKQLGAPRAQSVSSEQSVERTP